MSSSASGRRQWTAGAAALAWSVLLALVFWWPLWRGGGLVGGDVYSYYLPQKDFLVQTARTGEFPLWNTRTGHGYPLVAESQTAALYPFTWACYLPLSLNAAYNANHIVHYVLACLFVWMYARRLGLATPAALFAGLIYVYGWFPARCSLEWAIIGGTWLPASLWAAESYLGTRRWRYLLALSLIQAIQMLAGHFSLVFITQLTLLCYVPLRLLRREATDDDLHAARRTSNARRDCGMLLASLAMAFGLASVQLLPTWELKQTSQRQTVSDEHDPEYGHIPPLYLTQLVASWWYWYAPDVDADKALAGMEFLASDARTNKVEAHLYFGLVPLAMILFGVCTRRFVRGSPQRVWLIIGLLFLAYTPGWFVPLTRYLPGFSFFEGPGRYGVTTTFAAAILAASVASDWLARGGRGRCAAIMLVLGGLTTADLFVAGRAVAVARLVETPPISRRDESVVRRVLQRESAQPVRLHAPGPNLPTLCEVAATPVYLGLAPAAYFDESGAGTRMPEVAANEVFPDPRQLQWIDRMGVTHVLSMDAIDHPRLEQLSAAGDRFLNAAWGRHPFAAIYVYRVRQAPGRVQSDGGVTVDEYEQSANTVTFRVTPEPAHTGAYRVILTDLMYPGWEVTVDDEDAVAIEAPGNVRAVDVPPGPHRIAWHYRPRSVYFGALLSGLALLMVAGVSVWRWRRLRTPGESIS